MPINVFSLHRRSRLVLTTVVIGIAVSAGISLSAGPAHATYAYCPGANLVQSAAKSFVAASQTHDPSAFGAAISRYVDLNGLALFALGPFRSKLPPDRKDQYVAKTRAFIGRFLANHAQSFDDSELQIAGCADGQIRSVAGGRSIVWRLSGNRVSDVQVEGVWLVTELRAKFVSVLRDGQGDIDSLFQFLDQNG